MVASEARTVDEYLAQSDPERRPALETFRKLVRRAAPLAVESMQYGMPSYMLGGQPFAAFNAQKNYLSLYVMDTDLVAKRHDDLGGLDCGKSCIRGREVEQFPLAVLSSILDQSAARRARGATSSKRAVRKKAAPKAKKP
jgi:uncharacterized protein YdhG (YjbR/CyaY superfamily)